MKKVILFLSVGAMTLFLSGCGAPTAIKNSVPGSEIASSTKDSLVTSTVGDISNKIPSATKSAPIISTISIENFSFNPATLIVKKGTTVTWVNNDQAPHQIKSNAFNSIVLNTGQDFSFIFQDAGTFDYLCSIHPSMVGKIIVQ